LFNTVTSYSEYIYYTRILPSRHKTHILIFSLIKEKNKIDGPKISKNFLEMRYFF